jgi:acetyl esterase/lipase
LMAVLAPLPSCASEPGDPQPDVPPGTRQLRNLVYAQPDGMPLHLDLYVPPSDHPVPLVIWVHGGGWSNGDKEDPPHLPLLQHGYAAASVEYRLTDKATFPAQIYDVKAAVRFLRANAVRFGLDPDRFGAWGESAGGHLVALLGTTSVHGELEGDEGVTGVSSAVQAVCDWFGPTDLTQIARQAGSSDYDHESAESAESRLLGGPLPKNYAKARIANPIAYVAKGAPPFYIMHGNVDEIVPLGQSELLVKALRAVDTPVKFTIIRGGGHSGEFYFTASKVNRIRKFFDKYLKAEH